MDIAKAYHYLFEEIADPRVANFPLMKDPFAVTLILLAYLEFVLHIGPRYMKNRKPYKLNNFLILYNSLLAIASGVTCYGILTSGYTTNLSLGCEPYRISYEPEPLRMAGWVWWVFIMKVVELSDTIIFVLRKKFNQTSFLHVYHHATTVFMAWVTCKYVPAGMWTFIIIPNCMVHVIMYTYYLLAACGPEVKERINPAKKYITKLQMIQFTVMLIHTAQAFMPSCDPNRKYLACLYAFQVIVIFYMFCGFYKKSYTEKKLE
ncbi:PREDICTED: elongation of very long chain fatty acids protein 1-like [Polistes canadensis]|uniref:elongation of very long chain fatty acids protein 1-like n=1 Tax=Polistes canadensis TaxID=91411 RepID=UPI000718F137|nr:PREDICTED: elongation of very long chain fatty acids protein 1-like [Polistes canadensis]